MFSAFKGLLNKLEASDIGNL